MEIKRRRGRPNGSYKYLHPITKAKIPYHEYITIARKLKVYPESEIIRHREAVRKYVKNNPDRFKRLQREWRERNKDHLKETLRKYYMRPEIKKRLRINRRRNRLKIKSAIYGMTLSEHKKFISTCSRCGFNEYDVDVHHINHNEKDNRKENLMALCPNCHMGHHRGKIKL